MLIRTTKVASGLLILGIATVLVADEQPRPAPGGRVQAMVRAIKVLPDRAPDCSSLRSIVQTVTRGCKTNDERAIALYNFMILAHYHRAYPSEPGGVPVLKEINTYGWCLCGGLHSAQSALWRELGWEWRFVGWNGHTTVEAKYDGRWHYLDAFLKFYAWMPDPNAPGGRTIAGEDDLTRSAQELIADAFVLDQGRGVVYAKNNQFEMIGETANWTAPAFLSCGDTIADVIAGLKTHKPAGKSDGWNGIDHATGGYSADVDLAPGYSLTNTWDSVDGAWYWSGSKEAPRHTCGNKDLRNSPDAGLIMEPYCQHVRGYANGTLVFAPDLSSDAILGSFAATENLRFSKGTLAPDQAGLPASVTILLRSPYLMSRAAGIADGADTLEISVDDGKSFKAAPLADFTEAVRGHVSALARISFKTALKSLRLEVVVQNNPGSLPYLSPGRNTISVSAADPTTLGDNRLVVTYAYAPGYRTKSFEQLCIEGKEIAKGHNAVWEDSPTVVQKTFTAGELPATFDIDIATPGDRYPVYPKMLFVRREVIAAGSRPLPLPANAHAPLSPPDAQLKSLPNPFLIGSQPPPARAIRKTQTVRFDLKPGYFVARSGQRPTTDFIKWPKNAQEKVEPMAFLIGGELPVLPKPAAIAGARLVFPVVRSHPEASTKVAVVGLKAPFDVQTKYDFANLGDVLGTVIVPKLASDEADWNPPREFKVDLARAIRAQAGDRGKFNGFALRIVPDRGVDDGWTVRVHLPRQPKIYLEVDTYADQPGAGR